MLTTILEQYICAKTGLGDLTCEDGLLVIKNEKDEIVFIIVVDGASSKTKLRINGLTTGQIAKDVVLQTAQNMPHDIDCPSFIKLATENIAKFYKDNNLYETAQFGPQNRATCCVGVYSAFHQQIWIAGDIQLMLDGQVYDHTIPPDTISIPARVFYIRCELAKGQTEDEKQEIKEKFMEYDIANSWAHGIVDRQAVFQNSDDPEFGYAVLDGFQVPLHHVKVYDVSNTKEVIMSSDGYPFLENSLEKSEKELSNLLQNDPLCIGSYRGYKAVKGLKKGNVSFDDRTYIRFIK